MSKVEKQYRETIREQKVVRDDPPKNTSKDEDRYKHEIREEQSKKK